MVEAPDGYYLARPLQNPDSTEMPVEQIFPDLLRNNLVVCYVTSACQVNCLVYDSDTNVIKPFQQDTAMRELKVPSKPKLFCVNHRRDIFAMTFGQSTDITVITNDSTETIPAVEHGFRSLDALQIINDLNVGAFVLLAWDFNRQICGIFRQNMCDFKWVLASVLRCNFSGVDITKYGGMLGVECNYYSSRGNWDSFYVTLKNIHDLYYTSFSNIAGSVPTL